MSYSKAALAIDIEDLNVVESALEEVRKTDPCTLMTKRATPDNTYVCFYWEFVDAEKESFRSLKEAVKAIRHSLMIMDKDSGDSHVESSVMTSDSRGCDEEFYEMLHPINSISFFIEDEPLDNEEYYVPISRQRLINAFRTYVSNDYDAAADTAYVYQALTEAGLYDEEIEALGFGYVMPEEEEVEE